MKGEKITSKDETMTVRHQILLLGHIS